MKLLIFSTHSMTYIWYSPQKSKYPLYTCIIMTRVSVPSEFKEGTSGLSDIPLPKKLRTSEEETKKGGEGEKEEEEWCEVRL